MALVAEKINTINIDYALDYYNAFIDKQSENTAKAYKTSLKVFFDSVYNKEYQFVTITDLKETKMIDVMKYYQFLNEKYNKINTVNKHVKGVRAFFKFMNREYDDISDKIFDNIDLKNPELDSNGWDGLDWCEAIQIWEFAENNFGSESKQVSMLFKLASITSIRLNALLELEWEKNWFSKRESNGIVNYIEIVDKGKKNKKPVSESFYNELQEKLGTSGKLFPNMYPNKVGNYLKKCVEALGFDPRRQIKFHSFKKAGVMRALQVTGGNMYKAKEQGNHSSMTTAEKYYLKYKECLTDMTSYILDEEIDVQAEISLHSKEELVNAILQMQDSSKIELVNILKGL